MPDMKTIYNELVAQKSREKQVRAEIEKLEAEKAVILKSLDMTEADVDSELQTLEKELLEIHEALV